MQGCLTTTPRSQDKSLKVKDAKWVRVRGRVDEAGKGEGRKDAACKKRLQVELQIAIIIGKKSSQRILDCNTEGTVDCCTFFFTSFSNPALNSLKLPPRLISLSQRTIASSAVVGKMQVPNINLTLKSSTLFLRLGRNIKDPRESREGGQWR
jgi:hypothetical protein